MSSRSFSGQGERSIKLNVGIIAETPENSNKY